MEMDLLAGIQSIYHDDENEKSPAFALRSFVGVVASDSVS